MPLIPAQSTFSPPLLSNPLSIPELYDWHYVHSRNHPLFVYEDELHVRRTITMGEGVQGFHRASQYILKQVGCTSTTDKPGKTGVFAILASSESVVYHSVILGALRIGIAVFPISPRNSAPALASLLSETNTTNIIVSSEPHIQALYDDAVGILDKNIVLRKIEMPLFQELFPREGFDTSLKLMPATSVRMDSLACVYHSSGTTSFPKPVYWTHLAMYMVSTIPTLGGEDLSCFVLGCHSVPMYHAMGALSLIFPASTGMTAAVFKPQLPPVIPNVLNVLRETMATNVDYVFCPPSLLEDLTEWPDYVQNLSMMKGVIFSGGPLSKKVGDFLSSRGVNIILAYGSTQTALLSEFIPASSNKNWEYFRFTPGWNMHLQSCGDDIFEVIVLTTGKFKPYIVNTTVDGRPAYATGDLVMPHGTEPDRFRLLGRADDQIVHSSGEKTNPTPLEHILNRDKRVESSIIFGRGKFHCGVLIQPQKNFSFDPSDKEKLLEYRSAVWPSVEKMNELAPTHSWIFREMIITTSLEKPMLYTSKQTLRRQYMIDGYAAEIEELYASVSEKTLGEITKPSRWTKSSTLSLVRKVVESTLKAREDHIDEEADMFEQGLDSLRELWVRNTILRVMRSSHAHIKLPSTFVYEHPSIKALASFVYNNISGSLPPKRSSEEKLNGLYALVDRYTKFLSHENNLIIPDVVLLTGSTGSLGSMLLMKLIQKPSITRVFTLCRPLHDRSGKDRLVETFSREGIDLALLESEKLTILNGDPNAEKFGVSVEQYSDLLSSVTHIIHAAWRVDFNASVTSFESNIRGVRWLIDFSLRGIPSPARILFISSIGVFRNYCGDGAAPEETVGSLEMALGSGYSESKLIAEHILCHAATNTPVKALIIRAGQLTGGENRWNEHEWFPSLIKSSINLKKFPMVEGSVSWISSSITAGTILDMMHSDEQVFHIAHPKPTQWVDVIQIFSDVFDLPLVAYEEWVESLENLTSSIDYLKGKTEVNDFLHRYPALRILEFFQSGKRRLSEDFEPLGVPKLALDKALNTSSILREAAPIGKVEIEAWITNWRTSGFLD